MNQDTYSEPERRKLLRDFDRSARILKSVMVDRLDREFVDSVERRARAEFEALLPRVPYIGGKKNSLTYNLAGSAMMLALYRVLRQEGWSDEAIGQMIFDAVEAQAHRFPRWIARLAARLRYNRSVWARKRRQGIESQARRYPGDWVFTVIEGDGRDFEWGVDYTDCGICKLYAAEGAPDFLPYMCVLDYVTSDWLGMGMVRTTTLGTGGEKCDFRFKRGRPTQCTWPPGLTPPAKEHS